MFLIACTLPFPQIAHILSFPYISSEQFLRAIWHAVSQAAVLILHQRESESCSVMFDSLRPRGLYSPWNSPGKNTGVGSLSLLQGILHQIKCNFQVSHCAFILSQQYFSKLTVFWPGETHGQRSQVGYSPQDHKESDTTENNLACTLLILGASKFLNVWTTSQYN